MTAVSGEESAVDPLEQAFAAPAARPGVRLTLEIEDKRYGAQLELPKGFPLVGFGDEEGAIHHTALQVAAAAFNTFVKHYTEDGNAGE